MWHLRLNTKLHARQAVFPALTCISNFSTGRNEWGRKGRNGESAGGRRLGRVGRFLEPMLWPAFEGWEPTDWSLTTGEREQGERPSPFVLSHQLGWVCGGPLPCCSAQASAITFMELCVYMWIPLGQLLLAGEMLSMGHGMALLIKESWLIINQSD